MLKRVDELMSKYLCLKPYGKTIVAMSMTLAMIQLELRGLLESALLVCYVFRLRIMCYLGGAGDHNNRGGCLHCFWCVQVRLTESNSPLLVNWAQLSVTYI